MAEWRLWRQEWIFYVGLSVGRDFAGDDFVVFAQVGGGDGGVCAIGDAGRYFNRVNGVVGFYPDGARGGFAV